MDKSDRRRVQMAVYSDCPNSHPYLHHRPRYLLVVMTSPLQMTDGWLALHSPGAPHVSINYNAARQLITYHVFTRQCDSVGHCAVYIYALLNYLLSLIICVTRTVQPMATCRQSPYVQKPAIVKLLLLIQFPIQICIPCNDHVQPAMPTVADNLVKLIAV